MITPSPHQSDPKDPREAFAGQLEQKLRMAYRYEFFPVKAKINAEASFWPKFFGYGGALFGSLLVGAVFIFNLVFPSTSVSTIDSGNSEMITFDQGQAEEEIFTDFENEMNQIDQGLTLAVSAQ